VIALTVQVVCDGGNGDSSCVLKTYIEDVVDVPSRTVLKTNGNNLVCLVVDQDAPPTVCDVSCSAHFLRIFSQLRSSLQTDATVTIVRDRCNLPELVLFD